MKAMFVLVMGGDNPAKVLNCLHGLPAGYLDEEEVSEGLSRVVCPARRRIARALLDHVGDEYMLPALDFWARIELVNEMVGRGSQQKILCPLGDDLPGSARWQAADHGGSYRVLRDAVLKRARLDSEQVEALEALFDAFPPHVWVELIEAADKAGSLAVVA